VLVTSVGELQRDARLARQVPAGGVVGITVIFPRLSLALEVKLARDKEKSRGIVDEINADIRAYSKSYASLLFVIYDLGSIRDETEFTQDLETTDGTSVIIVKH
jgi:DpnII restriction endonuclease